MKQTDEQIKQHIINLVKNQNESLLDRDFMKEYKKQIVSKSNEVSNNQGLDYMAKMIIDDIDRHLLNIEKSNFDITKINFDMLIDYIKSDSFQFKEYLSESIRDNQVEMFGWSENIDEILTVNSLIISIVTKIHLLNLVSEDEKQNLSRKRDQDKIKNAIDTLLLYTNDEQAHYYINSIKLQERDITKSTILSCIFCDTYKICEELFLNKMNKNQILVLAKDIMYYVFDSDKDYRPYTDIEPIDYKGYKLRMFKTPKKNKKTNQ